MFEQIIGLIAPTECLSCGSEGAVVCSECLPSLCGRSVRALDHSVLKSVTACCSYDGLAKELVAKLKFERCRAAGTPMARAMAGLIAGHPKEIGLVHIPTASSRARMRGYDQSQLLAMRIAQITGLPYLSLLHRQGQLRQVGQHRAERSRQLSGAFWVSDYAVSPNITYILVDDVITTGSTFVAAATALQKAGATKLMGISFAAA